MANVDGFIDDSGNSYTCVDAQARESISHWETGSIASVMFNNNMSDGNLNIVVNHADGSSRTIVFSRTGLKYYEKAVGGNNALKWQYTPSQ